MTTEAQPPGGNPERDDAAPRHALTREEVHQMVEVARERLATRRASLGEEAGQSVVERYTAGQPLGEKLARVAQREAQREREGYAYGD